MRTLTLKDDARFRYLTFFYLYIMQGIPAGFALTTIANYLLGHHVPSQKVGAFIAIFGLPWTFQFIWGPLIDRYQYSVIGHRKLWVVLSQLITAIASLGLLIVKDPLNEIPLMSALFFIYSIFASIEVASVDAMAIAISPKDQRGRINGYMRGGFLLGSAIGAAGLSSVLHIAGFRSAALIQTIILLLFTIVFFFTKPEQEDVFVPWAKFKRKQHLVPGSNPKLSLLFKRVYEAITNQKSLKYFGLVAIVYFCSSVFIRSYTYYLINVLQWPDNTVSFLQGSWGSIITFITIIIAGAASDKIGAKKLQLYAMWGVALFLIAFNASYNLWQYKLYSGAALILWNLADPLLSVTIFPILMGLCWQKVEGSQFTTYLALINLCDVLGSYITGWCVNIIFPPMLGLFCGLIMLTILLVLKFRGNYKVIPDC